MGVDREGQAFRREAERAVGAPALDAALEAEQDQRLAACLERLGAIWDEQERLVDAVAAETPASVVDRVLRALERGEKVRDEAGRAYLGRVERLVELEAAVEAVHEDYADLAGSGAIDRALGALDAEDEAEDVDEDEGDGEAV